MADKTDETQNKTKSERKNEQKRQTKQTKQTKQRMNEQKARKTSLKLKFKTGTKEISRRRSSVCRLHNLETERKLQQNK